MLFNKIFIQVRKVMINQDISLVYRLFIQLTMRKWCVCVCVCSYTIMLRRFKIHIIDLSIVIYSFEWWWVCRLIPYYKDKWAVHSSDKRKKIEVCIFNTKETERESRNSNGLSERDDALVGCVIRIAKLFSDYTQFARIDMSMRQKKRMTEGNWTLCICI
jgi:hypothetical protein